MFWEHGNLETYIPVPGLKEITIMLNKTSLRGVLKAYLISIVGTQTVISSTIKRAKVSAFLIKML